MGALGRLEGLPDDALLAAMAVGDGPAGVLFVRRHQRRVFGLALAVLGDRSAAEDVAQEAFLRAWRHAEVFDPRRGAVTGWLLTITRNLAIDALRTRRQLPVDPADLLFLERPAGGQAVEDAALASEASGRARHALRGLPEPQRRAVVLAGIYGRTAAEVAELEGVPLGTAKTRIRSGLAKLRDALVEEPR